MEPISQNLRDQISELLKPHRVCLVMPVVLNHSGQSCGRSAKRFLVLSLWRGYLVINKQPVRVESTFSYLEISSINIHSLTEIVLETDRQILSFSVLHIKDLEDMVSHMTASLKRIFPDSSPGKLLKMIPPDLQERLLTQMAVIEQQLNSQPGFCGGFSDTYAALCDFNEMPSREEIQWDVDNIYHINNWRHFNLQDFSHLDSRDLALAVAALSFNQWFTRIYCRELKLSVDVQQQLTFLLSRSPSLEELSLETSGLKLDFALKMAAALKEHTSSTLQSINLSGNPIEDKGVIALSPELGNLAEGLKHLSLSRVSMTARGLGCLSQVLSSNQLFSTSLSHLDLSGNPGSLVTEEATFLFRFLSRTNSLSHLDLSDTNCPLDTLFVSLSAGCCYKLMHLNLARNPFSHRKVREVTRSIREFFSQSCELRYVGLSATKLPPQALRLLLQGLATNPRLFGLELDLSSCELRSAGAQVIQEHISEATAIRSLDISDNGFENDMVTLVLSAGRCHSLRHLALGRNFAMKSRALTDVLHRIAQLIQDEECPLQSLSVCDSKLKTGMHILLSALGGHAALAEVDISGNNIGDTGAKMLAKALMNNTRLRTLTWDRNCVTARGFQDVADALERNFTLQQVALPLADITQSYRSNPDRTKEALFKIQQCLDRNNQRQSDRVELQQVFRAQQFEKQVQGVCRQLEDSLQRLNHCNIQEVHADIQTAHEVLHNAKESFKLLPSLYEAGRTCASDGDMVNSILTDTATALTDEFQRSIQELAQDLVRCAEAVCPRVVQRSSVYEYLSECVSKRSRQTQAFLRSTLVENTGHIISDRLRELRQTLSVSLAESITEQVLHDLTRAQDKMDCLIKENSCLALKNNVPELRLVDSDFPTDDYSPAFWRNSLHSKSLRPASSIKSLLDADWEQQTRDRGAERERGGGAGEEGGEGGRRCGLLQLPVATALSVTASSPAPSPTTSQSPSPPGWRGRRRREGEVVAVDAAAAISGVRGASFIPPPSLPLLYSISARAPEEEAASCGGLPRREVPFPGCGPSPGPLPHSSGSPASPMEPLPTQGQTLRHYTASRPRPRRTHTQPPSSRPQEPVSKVENESSEGMGRVDEGVEEFFTKKIIPDYALKGRWEESNPAQATPPETSSTPSILFSSSSDNITSSTTTTVTSPSVPSTDTSFASTDVLPLSTSSTPPAPPFVTTSNTTTTTTTTTALPTKNIKKKFGDFFAFKRARTSRASKAGGGEGGGEGVKVKRTSIADLIRPLREAKERERERERDKEREKGRGARSVEDANISNDAATTEGTVATSHHLAGDVREMMPPAKTLTTTTPPSETTPSYPTVTTSSDLTTATLTNLEEEAAPVLPGRTPSPVVTSPLTEQERSNMLMKEMKLGGTPYGERRLKVTKRSLREGKSQSLILLTGLEPEDKNDTHSKKHASESTSSFEQKLQVMLHRMGVSKTPPADAKASQNKDEELRKANSEGAILDKPEPPPTYMKPRTMSTSSADPRHPMRALDPIRPEPPLHPKPVLPERPSGPLPPKPVIAAKPPIPTPATPAGGSARPSSAPPSSSSAERVQLRAHTPDGRPGETTAQNGSQEGPQGAATASSPRKELLPPALSPWRAPSSQDRSEKAQSVTDESLPKPRQHMKPLPQRRAVSVHEDTLAMTQELKAVLQRSPIRFRVNRGDLPPCTEDPCSGAQAQGAKEGSGTEKQTAGEKEESFQKEELNRALTVNCCVCFSRVKMAAGPLSVSSNASTNNDGILIGDKVYSEVYLTIDNSLIPEERLSPTPSMLDGLDLNTETDLRILGCELIQSAGILLRLPQVAMATGQVLFHRFFYSKSFVKHSFEIVAMACINLASKIEEAPRRIRDVINVFHHLRQIRGKKTPSSLILDQNYINTKNQVIKAERRVLKELGFCVHVKHPHKIIVMYLQVLECEKNQTLVQTAWNYMNDTLRTNVFVRFQAETIACACIFLAARALQIPLPSRPHWYLLFGATEDEVKEICITTLKLYTRKKPNYDQLEKEVERRKVFLAEAKLKAKGLNPDGTPALSTLGGFSPASKPCSPNVVKVEEKSPNPQTLKPVKKEPDNRTQVNKSPHNGLRKEVKIGRNSRSGSRSRSRTRSRSRSRSPRRHYNSRRSRSGTYSSRSRSRSHSRSPSPRRHQPSPLLPHLKSKTSHHSNSDSKPSGRHSNSGGGGSGHKRKRTRSRSRSRTPVKVDRDRDRERERERDRDRGSFDLSSKKHKHERGAGHRGDRRERERSRSYDRDRERERSHKSKHHSSSGHSGHSRHRR